MRVIVMFLYLMSGDVVKLPVTLTADQSCSDKLIQMVQVYIIKDSRYLLTIVRKELEST